MPEPDAEGGRLVRPYALTRGRTRSAAMELAIEALVRRTDRDPLAPLPSEQRELVALATGPLSLAELAAYTRLPLGVVRVLVGDLCGEGVLEVVSHGLRDRSSDDIAHAGTGQDEHDSAGQVASTDLNLLERVLHGLRAL